MKIIPEKEEFLRETVRNAIALNPLVSIRKMQELVEHNTGRSISDKYVAKLMMKVRRQAIVQSDRKKMNERLAEVREKHRILLDHLNRVVYWKWDFQKEYGLPEPKYRDRFSAMRLISQMELALFRAELDAGMFEDKRAATEEMLRQGILPTDLHEQVIGVFRRWTLGSAENRQDNETQILPMK